jgi:hypothetical protein
MAGWHQLGKLPCYHPGCGHIANPTTPSAAAKPHIATHQAREAELGSLRSRQTPYFVRYD